MAVVSDAAAAVRAIARGATVLQLRAPGLSARRLEDEAERLVRQSGPPVLISSRCDVALAAAAAGVNLPESDIPPADARLLLGPRLIGRSVHSVEGARAAEGEGADFIIFGPIWTSPSHPGDAAQGLDKLAEVARAVRVPVIAIGGLTAERAVECADAGAAGHAGISMFR